MGQLANQVRAELEEALDQRREALNARMLEMRLKAETLDVTMPGKAPELGHQHPMYIVLDEIKDIFVGMGFGGRERQYEGVCASRHARQHNARQRGRSGNK